MLFSGHGTGLRLDSRPSSVTEWPLSWLKLDIVPLNVESGFPRPNSHSPQSHRSCGELPSKEPQWLNSVWDAGVRGGGAPTLPIPRHCREPK